MFHNKPCNNYGNGSASSLPDLIGETGQLTQTDE